MDRGPCALQLWAAQRRLKGWRGSPTWRGARFLTSAELRRPLAGAGASSVITRYGFYLPPWPVPFLLRDAATVERFARPLGPLGPAFAVARAER